MILCLVRRPLDCGGVSGAIQMGNLQLQLQLLYRTRSECLIYFDQQSRLDDVVFSATRCDRLPNCGSEGIGIREVVQRRVANDTKVQHALTHVRQEGI